MWIVWIVVIFVALRFLLKLFAESKPVDRSDTSVQNTINVRPANSSQTTSSTPAKNNIEGTLQFMPGVLSERDAVYSKATFGNGVVYLVGESFGKEYATPQGYYKKVTGDPHAEYKVYREKEHIWETGFVGRIHIWLSRQGGYDDLKRFYEGYAASKPTGELIPILKYPSPMCDIFAEINGNYILDAKSGETIAHFTGDPYGAAAAFIALAFEQYDSKYSRFTGKTAWEKVEYVVKQ